MNTYQLIKTIHIISSTILFGTGLGTAFFMISSMYAKNIHEKHYAARFTVFADYIFTAPTVVLQPLTGMWLVVNGGYDLLDLWLKATYGLYLLAGLCWLPVVWIQIQLKKIVAQCVSSGEELPPRYYKLFKIWFVLGLPAFLGLVVIFFLMVMRPT